MRPADISKFWRARVNGAKERLVGVAPFRGMFLVWSFVKAAWFQLIGNSFEGADATLRYSRIVSVARPDARPSELIRRRNAAVVRRCVSLSGAPSNYLHASYVTSAEAERYRRQFERYGLEYARALKYPRAQERPDREGDLLLLKPYLGPQERGVLLVQYNDAMGKFAALYDLPRLARDYRIVLEPSTWGYEEAAFLMFLGLPTDVVVQAQFRPDYEYIHTLGHNLHPIDLGAGDWVDPETFDHDPRVVKRYDIIMVASWLALKRHALLFAALRPIARQIGRVALVGYPSAGRSLADIRAEAARHGVERLLDVYESVPPERVNDLLQRSRVSVMLTKREGASRAIYESLFSNTPVIVSKDNVGVNRAHINEHTGMFSTDEDLTENLLTMIRSSANYAPRSWALENTGYRVATRRLNAALKGLAVGRGESWTTDIYQKKNRPNAMYANDDERAAARTQFSDLDRFLNVGAPSRCAASANGLRAGSSAGSAVVR